MTSTVLPPATARAPMVQAMFPVPMMLMLLMIYTLPWLWLLGLNGGSAAVGDEFHAVDVAGVVGGEEEGSGGDFVGVAHLAAGDEGFELALGGLVEEFFLLGGGDLAGGEDVDADAAVLELVEPDAGPGLLDGLAAGVDAPAGEGAEGGVGAGHEDGAAVVEEREGLLDGEQGAAGVEPEPGVELGFGDLAERGGLAAAGAGPQHVEAALLPLDGVVQAVQVVQVGGVALDAGDVAADLLDGRLQGVLAAAGDEDVRSLVGEQLRAGQRHAGGAAGDDRYLAVKLSHGLSFGSVVPCALGGRWYVHRSVCLR